MDLQTIEKIKKEAHPKLRGELQKIYEDANNKLGKSRLRFSMILRTFKEQDDIYAQGRTKKGEIVTYSKAGQSYHNYGLAVDIVMLLDKDGNGTYETIVSKNKLFWAKNDSRTIWGEEQWIKTKLDDKKLDEESYRSFLKSYGPDWDMRFGVYYEDDWHLS